MNDETICAVSSPPGIGGLGIIRVSGPGALGALDGLFRNRRGRSVAVSRLPSHVVRYGLIVIDGQVQDEVLLTVMRAPRSYTREDMAEIGCHGGPASLRAVMGALLARGCRLAEPGEFTRRAFLSGRIDLAQAEAVLAVINSGTDRARAAALRQLGGENSRDFTRLGEEMVSLLAEINAELEFPEDLEAGPGRLAHYRLRLAGIDARLAGISAGREQGRLLGEGLQAAIIGRPNVGKSSLLNLLLAEARAIVSEIPGTTRDEVSERISIGGLPLKLIDTAGISRRARDRLEEIGVARSLARLKTADLVLLVLDRSEPPDEYDRSLLDQLEMDRAVIVLNKSDLPARLGIAPGPPDPGAGGPLRFPRVAVSALDGSGLGGLKEALLELIRSGRVVPAGGEPVFLSLRQEQMLARVREGVAAAGRALAQGLPLEFAAADLRRALEEIGAITGKNVAEDVLNDIFSRFCIGK